MSYVVVLGLVGLAFAGRTTDTSASAEIRVDFENCVTVDRSSARRRDGRVWSISLPQIGVENAAEQSEVCVVVAGSICELFILTVAITEKETTGSHIL